MGVSLSCYFSWGGSGIVGGDSEVGGWCSRNRIRRRDFLFIERFIYFFVCRASVLRGGEWVPCSWPWKQLSGICAALRAVTEYDTEKKFKYQSSKGKIAGKLLVNGGD